MRPRKSGDPLAFIIRPSRNIRDLEGILLTGGLRIDPAKAFDTCVTLNDRYFLDGRDPNGYAGVAWSIVGKFDRPWFDRPIFGTIRYMSGASTGKKFNSKKYIQRMSEDFTQTGFWAEE